jgi:hypothetical protein
MKKTKDDKRVCLNIALTPEELATLRAAASQTVDSGGRIAKCGTWARGVLLAVARGER